MSPPISRRRPAFPWRAMGIAGLVALLMLAYRYQQQRDQARGSGLFFLDPDPAEIAARPIPDVGGTGDADLMPARPSRTIDGALRPNEPFVAVLEALALPRADIYASVAAMGKVLEFKRLRPGTRYSIRLFGDGALSGFRITLSPLEVFEAERGDDGYTAVKVKVDSRTEVAEVKGRVRTTFSQAVAEIGEGSVLLQSLLSAFSWEIDFYTDTRKGDRFVALVEKVYVDKKMIHYGRLLAVGYDGAVAGAVRAAAWTDSSGESDLYDLEGRSMSKVFLKTPLKFTRISSGFSRSRYHPILHRARAHLGVDYAAPKGTPVRAIGAGRVAFAGWKGGNGNLVVLHHSNGYRSHYAHLSSFGRGMRAGAKVKQKQIIGRVGSTGLSTGAHLHFGLSRGGQFVNPLQQRLSSTRSLTGEAKRSFIEASSPAFLRIEELLAKIEREEPWPP